MKSTMIIVLMGLSVLLAANEDKSLSYIDSYKHIAVSEMHRTGIPASIKLAQGLLESGAGQSTLAREANNHFGIKCGGSWEGGTFYREDDDHDKNGKLIKSCFRRFSDASASFYAHSSFLTDQKRYAFLFDLSYLDYHAWAKGLKKAGYATDKAYPAKLIAIIEKYQLYQYDDKQPTEIAIGETNKKQNNKASVSNTGVTGAYDVIAVTEGPSSSDNRRKRKSKKKFSLFKKKKSRVVTQHRESKSQMVFHIVQEGQNLNEIAMIHRLDETKLRLRNRIPKNAEPLSGEYVYLRKKISILKRPQFSRVPNNKAIVSQDEYIF